MSKDFENPFDSYVDAFIELSQIDDEDALSLLSAKGRKKLEEGKSFSIHNFDSMDDAKDFMSENTSEEDIELEVIDANADVVEHLRDHKDYLGQAILRCNRCLANRFIDTDQLVVSEDNPETFNVEDECPNCHANGYGYELIGQVGKFTTEEETSVEELPEEPEEEISADEPATEVPAEENAEVSLENDEKSLDDAEATFQNDAEIDKAEVEAAEEK